MNDSRVLARNIDLSMRSLDIKEAIMPSMPRKIEKGQRPGAPPGGGKKEG